MTKAVKTRAQFAAEIKALHKKSIEAIFEIGRVLIAAKKALAHGEFEEMIESDLPFDTSTAQRLMISRDPRLRKAAQEQLLPAAFTVLYELSQLPDERFEAAISSGDIRPQMTRADARTIRFAVERLPAKSYTLNVVKTPPVVSQFTVIRRESAPSAPSPMRLVASTPAASEVEQESEQGPILGILTLERIERLVDELAAAVEDGNIQMDDALKGRIRLVAGRLLAIAAA